MIFKVRKTHIWRMVINLKVMVAIQAALIDVSDNGARVQGLKVRQF